MQHLHMAEMLNSQEEIDLFLNKVIETNDPAFIVYAFHITEQAQARLFNQDIMTDKSSLERFLLKIN